MAETVSVIVVGAGPAGAVASWRLAQLGVDVLLLEAHAAPPEDMRASTLHPPDPGHAGGARAAGAAGRARPARADLPVPQPHHGGAISLDLTEIADVARHPYRLQCEQFKRRTHWSAS